MSGSAFYRRRRARRATTAIIHLLMQVVCHSPGGPAISGSPSSRSAGCSLAGQKQQPCEAVDVIARAHLSEVKRKLADLAALKRELESLIGQCRHRTIAECRIIEALAPATRGA
jgi:hypothetical protein